MSTVPDPMKSKISLHGLGFIQVQLEGNQRLHVWHPDLPRRKCYEFSAIHDHRFSFTSTVLVGEMRNLRYLPAYRPDGTHMTYLHEGPRTPKGGRPWTPDGRVDLVQVGEDHIAPGGSYRTPKYEFHQTTALGDGIVVTLMRKLDEGTQGAHSTCLVGVEPDVDFDRFQVSDEDLWKVVTEALRRTP